MSLTANISNISRCSVHDGPGVRTVVFFKGCGLRCRWCHNPETLSVKKDILYAKIKCIHCGRCVEACPEHHVIRDNDMVYLRDGCNRCGRCASVCPSGALSISGEAKTLDEVWKELIKDRHFYQASGGGITLSGGECLLQSDFAAELMKRCREEGIHTAVETALFVPWTCIEKVVPYCDLFLTDFKIPDPLKHKEYTGQDNGLILSNLRKLIESVHDCVIIRIPLIPGVNDSVEDMRRFASVFSSFPNRPRGIELLKYNALAEGKYQLAGMSYESFGPEAQPNDHVSLLCEALRASLNFSDVYFNE